MTDDLDALASAMEQLGIEPEEAKVYLALLDNGPARASTAAKLAGFSRGRTYRILDTLAGHGWIAVQIGHPRIFEPLPPERLFEDRITHLQREEMRVEDLKDDLLPRLHALGEGTSQTAANWTLLEGRLPIYRSLIKMVERAEETVHVASNHAVTSSSLPVVRAAWQALSERLDAGVEARCLVPPDWTAGDKKGKGDKPDGVPELPGIQVRRLGSQPPVHVVIVDEREALQWLVLDDPVEGSLGADVAVRSDAEGLVGPARLLFETLWETADKT